MVNYANYATDDDESMYIEGERSSDSSEDGTMTSDTDPNNNAKASPLAIIYPSPPVKHEVGETEPTAEDKVPEKQPVSKEELQLRKSHRTWLLLAIFVTLCAGAVAASIPLFFMEEEEEALVAAATSAPTTTTQSSTVPSPTGSRTFVPTDADTTGPPTVSPTTSLPTPGPSTGVPTAQPTTLQSTRIQPVLEPVVHDVQTLLDPSSPEHAAMKWLQRESTLPLETDAQIVQRYAVVATITALQQQSLEPALAEDTDSTVVVTSPLVDPATDVCEWEGVECNFGNETAILQTWINPGSTNLTDAETAMVVTALKFSNTGLEGTISDDIGLLSHLTHLDLAENSIEGSIPEGLYDLTELEYLFLFQNRLTGTISSSIENMQKLRKVLLGNNGLTGPLPQEVGSSQDSDDRPLEWLSLYDNMLTGQIPENLNLGNLFYLDLGRNDLSGNIPDDWVNGDTQFSSLRLVYLDFNRFEGRLPNQWANLGDGRIRSIVLTNNTFTGEVPGDYSSRDILEVLDIENNDFSKLGKNICKQIVFEDGQLTTFRVDCDICNCNIWCDEGFCNE